MDNISEAISPLKKLRESFNVDHFQYVFIGVGLWSGIPGPPDGLCLVIFS